MRNASTRGSFVVRVALLATLLPGIDSAQTVCTLSNGLATGFFGGVAVSGQFTSGVGPADVSSITVTGAPNSVYQINYTFTGPLNGPGYTQTSKMPPLCILGPPCPPPGQAGLHVGPPNGNSIASLAFEDTGELFTGSGTVSCNTPSPVKVTSSGLSYSRVSQTFNATITVTNTSNSAINYPLDEFFFGLNPPVTLANATGISSGTPYIKTPGPGSLAPGASITIPVRFKDPSNAPINPTIVVVPGS